MGQLQRLRRPALLPYLQPRQPELANLSAKAIHAPWLAGELELQSAGVVLGKTYPRPIVDHAEAREKTLARYAVVKKKAA